MFDVYATNLMFFFFLQKLALGLLNSLKLC